MKGSVLYCRACHRRIGMAPGELIWTGAVDKTPYEPDGLVYCQCKRCGKFQRYEIIPIDPPVRIHTSEEIAA
jgi:hypothetical protein